MARRKKSPFPARDEIASMAASIFDQVREVKSSNPAVARRIDRIEREIRDRIRSIRTEIGRLDVRDRDLVTIMVINGLQRTAEEELID